MLLRAEPGTLLAAWPDLMDPNFMHGVVLVCHHDENGAYGLVLNRPTEYTVRELLPDHPVLSASDFRVHLGGPVDHTALQFLHSFPDEVPGGVPLAAGLWLGGDLDALARILVEEQERAAAGARLFVGYSGWSPGQLEHELDARSWIPAPASAEVVFDRELKGMWRRVVRSVGAEGRDLESLPPDVDWN